MATQEQEQTMSSSFSFPEPTFGRAQRLTGFVATPPADWSSPMGVPLPTGARRHSWTTPTPNSGTSALPPSLSRQQSVAGNILVLTSTNDKDSKTTTTSAYLLQRKLEHMSNGYTVRVGYPLVVDDNDGDDDAAMNDDDNDNSNRVWEVQPGAPLVAIHIHPASCLASANTTLPEAVQYDPRAEWFVWQQQESNHSLLLTSLHGGFENKTTNDKDKSCYYSITPLHTSTVWDDLCQRKEPYSEEEARHVFLQILECLERLQQMGLCHRNVTLHNLLLVNDDNDDDTATRTTSAMAMDRGQASGEKSNHSTTGDSTADAKQQQAVAAKDDNKDNETTTKPKRLCLSRHGFALRVGGSPPNNNNNSSTPKLLPIPPPSTAQPLYVAPEWMTTTTNTNTTSSTTTTLVDPYAVDLWSATLCLLVLLIGAPNIASALYAAPVPADPRFVPVTQHVEAYFGNRLNLGWSRPLLDLLTHLLHPDPAQRLTLAQVQQHAWVTGQVDDDKDSSKPTAHVANKNGAKRQRTEPEPDQKDNNNGGTAAMQS